MLVGKRMTRNPKTVSPDDPLSFAAGILRENRFHHLPVIQGGRLIGILSDTDLRNASFTAIPKEGERGAAGDRPVREAMRTEVWSVTPDDSVEDALLILTREKFGALPVLSGDHLVGIITRTDLLNAFVDLLDVNEVCFCVDVTFPRNMARFEELVNVFSTMGVEVRSVLIAPQGEIGALNAHLRVATIDGPAVRRALREKGFVISERVSRL
ncbi:CBS domain-containing protein [Candidatus Deferrimicrobium sp.]|uniref:CBS domain-containing protein n=1 Tax=Candidatus Deferrimicrobium sp. TaxID=3060586 RepID=UPI002ED42C25